LYTKRSSFDLCIQTYQDLSQAAAQNSSIDSPKLLAPPGQCSEKEHQGNYRKYDYPDNRHG
jgi:hypothetical protein